MSPLLETCNASSKSEACSVETVRGRQHDRSRRRSWLPDVGSHAVLGNALAGDAARRDRDISDQPQLSDTPRAAVRVALGASWATSEIRGQKRAFGRSSTGVLVPAEANAIRDAAQRVLAGETLSSIVTEWNRLGLRTARGGPWRINSLSGLLLQERLTAPPAILDEETRQRLLALHASRRKGTRRATRHYLLTGVLRCSLCGAGLRGMSRTPRPDLYVCPGPPHGGCSGTAVTADRADAAVTGLVLARLEDLSMVSISAGESDMEQVSEELARHEHRLTEVAQLWASGEITRLEWLGLREEISSRVRVAHDELGRLERLNALRRLAGQGTGIAQEWTAYSTSERRGIIAALLDHIAVFPATKPRTGFHAERLRTAWRL